ncbi:MAG: class I SAM-dependent methyltransferase [Bacilli bacterium]|nr:class I SAM-dependent methyltransferase [Bacilli bacterium]MDD3305210.1 class I SAM-dependent methyltransferase [Bacilli bacterium]MDD4054011.1 class I SAM-dependent methyltransferase [Bacilli bacterium]MDD4411743.1 class I SAM-dependent methyltransferase [Bacilli bacterium]
MIKLSKRLKTIANYVNSNARIVDIGCDHALLDIYLVSNNPNIKAIAVDVKEGALSQARKNIVKYKVQEAIDLRLGDGLDVIEKSEINTVIISGLGCPKILEILTNNKDKLTNVDDLILQSNTDYFSLRKQVCALGYYIAAEELIKENNIIYVIINFKKGTKKYKSKDYLFGPFLRQERSKLYIELINYELQKKEILYLQIPRKYVLKRQKLRIEILKLKNELKRKS